MASVPVVQDSFEQFFQADLEKELLRFTTAGSVDDGKSTLIGRLLFDAKGVYEDQLASVKKSRVNRSSGPIDFSLLTDGLRVEREQGITIDVAYRYFATLRRKFIIADTPGHEQYTRNMVTGASTASLAIILLDASKGLLPQTRRHTYIASLLGIPNILVAVNKMDLVGYSEATFLGFREEFLSLVASLDFSLLRACPSAPWKATTSSIVVQNGLVFRADSAGISGNRSSAIRVGFASVPVSHPVRDPARFRVSRLRGTNRCGNDSSGRSGCGVALETNHARAIDRHV